MEGYCKYQKFQTLVKLLENERAKGTDIAQQQDITHFETSAVKLSFGNEKVATDNFTRLNQLGEPIVQLNAYHPNPKPTYLSAEDMGGLEPTIYLAEKARVMLTRNL